MIITCTYDTKTKEMSVKADDKVMDDVCEFNCCCDYGCVIRQEEDDEEEGYKSYTVTMAENRVDSKTPSKPSVIPDYVSIPDKSMLTKALRNILK